jgi:hypothetical protein
VYFQGFTLAGDGAEVIQCVDAPTRLAAWQVVAAEHRVTPKGSAALKVVAVHGPKARSGR